MVSGNRTILFSAVTAWLENEPAVLAAVLFGSSARMISAVDIVDPMSDMDLHIITNAASRLERVNWSHELPQLELCLQVSRPATGGVRKSTVVFATGQVDLVLIPVGQMRFARFAMRVGWHRKMRRVRIGLNEIATCLSSGYRILKGVSEWGDFYTRIASQMEGVRLTDDDLIGQADLFLCDLLWVLQKLERGELSAAQHALHRYLAETNFRLLRELRLRRGQPLPSFGIGRRVETLLTPVELKWVLVDARCNGQELCRSAWSSYDGLHALMRELVPRWAVPNEFQALLHRSGPTPAR